MPGPQVQDSFAEPYSGLSVMQGSGSAVAPAQNLVLSASCLVAGSCSPKHKGKAARGCTWLNRVCIRATCKTSVHMQAGQAAQAARRGSGGCSQAHACLSLPALQKPFQVTLHHASGSHIHTGPAEGCTCAAVPFCLRSGQLVEPVQPRWCS